MGSQVTKRYRTALYMRLSREDIDKEGESASIENQRIMLQRFAKEHSFTIYKEYVDDGISGTTFDRPYFQQLINDIESDQINLVIVKDLSRLGRDYIKSGDWLENFCPSHNVRFIAVQDHYDSDKPEMNDFVPFKNIFNEFYAKDTSRKIRATFEMKFKEGQYIGNFAPYGYKKDPLNKNHLIIDEQVAPVVQDIFRRITQGKSPAEIAKELNSEGVVSPAVYRCMNKPYLNINDYSQNKKWVAGTIQKMVKNIIYLGHMAQGKTKRISYKNKTTINKSRDEWIIKKNTHEAIIDELTFDIAKRRLQGRISEKGEFVNIFSGLVKCADCGRNMSTVGTRRKGSHANLACGAYKAYGSKKCTNHFIDYNVLYSLVLQAIKEQIKLTDEDKQEIINEVQAEKAKRKKPTKEEEIKKLQAEEYKINNIISSVYDDFYQEKINDVVKDTLIKQYNEKLSIITKKIKDLNANEIQKEKEQESYQKFAEMIKRYTDIQTLDSDILFTLIERIEVAQGFFEYEGKQKVKKQTIKIYFRFLSEVKISQYSA